MVARHALTCWFAILVLSTSVPMHFAHCEERQNLQQKHVLPTDPQMFGKFGYSVAVSGSTLFVGAFTEDGLSPQSGAVYVFERIGSRWVQQDKLVASDGQPFDFFGESLAFNGDTLVVGAANVEARDGIAPGAAYVFRRDGHRWLQEAKLRAHDQQDLAEFGGDMGVAISGDTIVVAASDAFTAPTSLGVVYVFERHGNGWAQTTRLTEPGGGVHQFANSVALSGDILLVGAPLAPNDVNALSGAAYAFRRSGSGWIAQARITAPDGVGGAEFGFSLSLSGTTAAIGAIQATTTLGAATGAAYVFRQQGEEWIFDSKLIPGSAASDDLFGFRVAVSGSTILVGAEGRDAFTGVAYIFEKQDRWKQVAELVARDGVPSALFGCSVATDGRTHVVGASSQPVDGLAGAGEAYLYRFK